ncbi:FUSC family protein [Bacillus glycinifermentans]|uniref:FUSC family protein n=1 Tax=Bacillus glycinifermentans TaxID=1664069 RepID=UPI0022E49C8E|nr:FUSC family protein [Bacillus glycinifermentans]
MDRKKKWDSEFKTMLIWKMAAASALSWEIAKAFGSNHPYLAPLSVILCLHGTVGKTVKFSLKRIAGTVIGVLLTAYIVSFVPHNGWVLGALLVLGLWISKWLKLDQVGLHQTAITILFVFSLGQQSNHYAFDRIIDTVIGVAVAILIHMIYPPNLTKYASESMRQFSIKINTAFTERIFLDQRRMSKSKRRKTSKRNRCIIKRAPPNQKSSAPCIRQLKI